MHARPDTAPNPTTAAAPTRGCGDAGATMVEYALLVALISVIAAGSLTFLGNQASTALDNATSSIVGTTSTTTGGATTSTTAPTPTTTTPPPTTTPPTTAPAPTTTTTPSCRPWWSCGNNGNGNGNRNRGD